MSELGRVLRPILKGLVGVSPKRKMVRMKTKTKRRAPVRRRVQRVAPRMRVSTIPASVNTASSIRASQTRNLRLESNTDRLFHTTVPIGTARGSIIYDQIITPAIAARLQTQASLFQKIQYRSLRFEVQTQTPTTNSGGYVVAYLHDPQMEVGTGEAALRALTAIQGTKTSKFWQSTDMNVKTTQQEYFTLQGNDIRLFSPGRFVVLSDGAPSEAVSITILFHWTVGLTKPALQRLVNRLPQAVVMNTGLYSSAEGLRATNWNPSTNVFTPALPGGNLDLQNAIYGVPPESSIGSTVLWYQPDRTIVVNETDTRTRCAGFISLRYTDGNLRGQLHTLPSDAHVIFAAAPPAGDTDVDWALFQGARATPITPGEFAGNEETSFLVSVLPSVSVNQQPMISKSYSEFKPTLSMQKQTNREDLLEKLSSLHLLQ